jgi:thiamine biosynthesis lipoprotein ApbE
VLAVSGLRSDALASAVSVLGPRKGVALIKELAKTEVYMGFQRAFDKPIQTNSTAGFPLKSKK